MALEIIRTVDSDLTRVQQNVAKELGAIERRIPAKKTPSTPITTDYSVKLTDVLVLALPETDINVTLPDVGTCVGQSFTIKNLSTAATVFVRGLYVGAAFQQVDQQDRYDCPAQTSVTCYSDGVRWWIV
jgi:hypothetical protein